MSRESPRRAILAVMLTAFICSGLVSGAVVVLRPIQLNNQLLERSRNILQLTGLSAPGGATEDSEIFGLYKRLDARIVDIDKAEFDQDFSPDTFDARKAQDDPALSVAIEPARDLAKLGRRSRFSPVYLVWKEEQLERVILPVHGSGMWSTLYGYIALEPDLNTIAAMIFYEQNETPGLGDQIAHTHWLQKWKGRKVYDHEGNPRFRISDGVVEPGSATADFEVDALTGATVTANAVNDLMQYWFGPDGYQKFLFKMRQQPPQRPAELNS